MGFEYNGASRTGAPISWETLCKVMAGFGEVEVLSTDHRSLAFNLRATSRDRTVWTEDGSIRHEADGSLYLVFHVGPQQQLVTRLQRSLAEAGIPVEFEEL
jgi:hypothetical protein